MPKDASHLKVWQLADSLALMVYRHTKPFPKPEVYGLTIQMRRAAVSVPANITEGAARKGQQEFLHFLYIASASLSELGYYIHLANRLDYLLSVDRDQLASLQKETARTLQGLITKVESDLNRRKSG